MRYLLFFVAFWSLSIHGFSTDRDEEIRNEMWITSDKTFKVSIIPKKWSEESAVIIAQLNRYEYRKPVMRNLLRYNEYNHFRIKLIDKNAITKYSELTFLSNRTDNAEGEYIKVYVGFKVIKPDGKEIIVDHAKAVKMEREYRGRKQSYNKLAIPNLEPGDILDYYICEETTRANENFLHFFEPVIYTLPQEYPVISHKLQFRAERKCYINLKSLNGAPELKLVVDEANDEKFYSLEGDDIEGVKDVRWVFPFREMPTVKFRAAFASGKAMRTFDVLLGEPGEVKNSVSKKEIQEMAATMLSTPYDVKFLTKYAKKNLKGVKDHFDIATKTYYYFRNQLFNNMESNVIQGNSPWIGKNEIHFVDAFSTFLSLKEIPHDIVLAVPRNIGSVNDLLFENEINWLIRVKKGNEYLYLEPFNLNTLAGTIDGLLEGTEAYAMDGLISPTKSTLKNITLPVTTSIDNQTFTSLQLDLTDIGKTTVAMKRIHKGLNKYPEQYYFTDPFDLRTEEAKNFEMEESSDILIGKKKYQALKEAYLSKRETERNDNLKTIIERDFLLNVKDVSNFKLEQAGRYQSTPEMIYSLDFIADNLVNKAGVNYTIDIGKLIEQQAKIEAKELDRKNNVYYQNLRSFKFKIEFVVPDGYQVQGLDKLNQKVENNFGGFSSTATEVNGKVIIETTKHYEVNYASSSDWGSIVNFLNAAYIFHEQKLLLKKK